MRKKEGNLAVPSSKKDKINTEPNELFDQNRMENYEFKSVCENNEQNEQKIHKNKLKISQHLANNNVNLVSPTFQTQISLKDEAFRNENKNSMNVRTFNMKLNNFDQKQISERRTTYEDIKSNKDDDKIKILQDKIKSLQIQKDALRRLAESNHEQLENHYKSLKFWPMLEKSLQDADFSIIKELDQFIIQRKTHRAQVQKLNNKIVQLEKQLQNDRNETRVLSQKKCKGCENYQMKEKENSENYQNVKKLSGKLEIKERKCKDLEKQLAKIEQEYQDFKILSEEKEKKRNTQKIKEQELNQKIKELEAHISEKRNLNFIQFQKLKQQKAQLQQKLFKLQQKYKKEINQYKHQLDRMKQNLQISQKTSEEHKKYSDQLKSDYLKAGLEKSCLQNALRSKQLQYEELKCRFTDLQSSFEQNKKNIEEIMNELKQHKILLDQTQNQKLGIEFELNQMKKCAQQKDQQIKKSNEMILELNKKIKDLQQNETRIKQAATNNFKNKSKSNYYSGGSHSNATLFKQVFLLNRQIFEMLQDALDYPQQSQASLKRREKEFQYDEISASNLEQLLKQNMNQLSNLINKYVYLQKDNKRLLEKTQIVRQQTKKQLQTKQDAMSTLLIFVPQELKQLAIRYLCAIENPINLESDESFEAEDMDQLKEALKSQCKAWRQKISRLQKKFKKYEQENEELKKKLKSKETNRKGFYEQEGRDILNRKQIKRKYQIQ